MIKIDFDPPRAQLRQFGWVALFAFPLIGAVLHFLNGWVGATVFWVLLGVGAAVFAAAMLGLWPAVRWVFVGLMVVVFPIGFAVSNILLALIYYLMFTPLALFFRLRGRDALQRRLDPAAETYWEARQGPVPFKRYLRMY